MTATSSKFPHLRVLYVDDDLEDYMLTCELLSDSETVRCKFENASSIEEAKVKIQNHSYDILLFDNNLGSESGIELIRWTRGHGIETPAIILTGQSDEKTDLQAMEAGASDFLVKGEINLSIIERSFRYALERARVEQTIQRNRQKFQALVEQIPEAILTLDALGNVQYASPRIESILGIGEQAILGTHISDYVLEKELETFRDNTEEVQWSKKFEIQMKRKGDSLIWVRMNPNPILKEGSIDIIQCLLTDISERKDLEIQLLHAQKLESIGQLSAGIAHEINTPCQFVSDNLSFLKQSFDDLLELIKTSLPLEGLGPVESEVPSIDEIRSLADKIDMDFLLDEVPLALTQSIDGISRVSKLVKAMKDFSHPSEEGKRDVCINECIETTYTVARNEWKYLAELETDFDETLPLVPLLPDEFNQVILNLITNAAHAIRDVVQDSGGKGIISIKTQRVGDEVEVRIKDSGKGIPENVRTKIFDPFFTTKEVGKGTGQGLSISHNIIVEKHKGTIHFETELGKGTTFIVRLPLIAETKGIR